MAVIQENKNEWVIGQSLINCGDYHPHFNQKGPLSRGRVALTFLFQTECGFRVFLIIIALPHEGLIHRNELPGELSIILIGSQPTLTRKKVPKTQFLIYCKRPVYIVIKPQPGPQLKIVKCSCVQKYQNWKNFSFNQNIYYLSSMLYHLTPYSGALRYFMSAICWRGCKMMMQWCSLKIIMTYVVSSLLSTISTLSKNQPALAWLLSWRILSFFRTPRSTAVMSKMSSWVTMHKTKTKGHRS